MNLPSLNELHGGLPFSAPGVTMNQSYTYPPPPHLNTQYYSIPRSEKIPFLPLTSVSQTLPTFDGLPAPQGRPHCEKCRGQKYGFTAYFHNTKIFPEPPHELLPWVERSYHLKNRLQSLLVTYTVHAFDPAYLRDIEIEVNNWRLQVEALVHEIGSWGNESELVVSTVMEVHQWAKFMVKQLWDHVVGNQILPMPKGRAKELVLEFRKGWERVWVESAEHRRQFMLSKSYVPASSG